MIADAVTIFGTYDIVMGECDRMKTAMHEMGSAVRRELGYIALPLTND